MSAQLTIQPLCGRYVRLEPLETHHRGELMELAQDPALWTYVPFDAATGYGGKFDALLADMARGRQVGYAVRRLSASGEGALVGSTSFMAIAPEHARLEIGAIWYAAPARGTMVNPETMLLMIDHALACGFNRIEFKADALNARSRGALKKLGATEEGILRQHMWLPQGRFRDSVYYAILAEEWPQIRARLVLRLKAFE